MNIPQFPDSREITLDDKPLFDELFRRTQPEISAYTFTNIFAWREPHTTGVSRIGDAVVVHYNDTGSRVCLEPVCDNPAVVIRETLMRFGEDNVTFGYVCKQTASRLNDDASVKVELDRDNSDYLYLASDLINLEGRRYDGKRNFISRLKASTDYEYVRLDGRAALECHKFAEEWCEERRCHTVEGLRKESCAVYQMLTHFDDLGLCGGGIRIGGAIAAFALGEALNAETLVCHVEKADGRINGLYQLINNEFAIHEGARFKYINREQDLGVPGLRKAKESYHPVRIVETYRVSLSQNRDAAGE